MKKLLKTATQFCRFIKLAQNMQELKNILDRTLDSFKTYRPELVEGIKEVSLSSLEFKPGWEGEAKISFLIDVDPKKYQELMDNKQLKEQLTGHFEISLLRKVGKQVKINFNYFPV